VLYSLCYTVMGGASGVAGGNCPSCPRIRDSTVVRMTMLCALLLLSTLVMANRIFVYNFYFTSHVNIAQFDRPSGKVLIRYTGKRCKEVSK